MAKFSKSKIAGREAESTMIFVSVGTQKFQLNRLLKEMDRLADNELKGEKIFAQTGYSDYKPQNFEFKNFINENEFKGCVNNCDLLITHSGVATIIAGVKEKKPVIVFPRLKKFGEHIDDHQLEIANAFSKQNFVIVCGEDDSLDKKIKEARTHSFSEYHSQRERIVGAIRDYLDSL